MVARTKNLLFSTIFLFGLGLAGAGCGSVPPPEASDPIAIDGKAAKLHGKRYLEYRVGIHIDAPPDKVWALLTDAAGYPGWNSTVTSIDGTIADGESLELKVPVAPDRSFNINVSDVRPNEGMVWSDGGGAFKGVRTFTLKSVDGGTDFTMAEVFTGYMLGMIEGSLPDFTDPFETFAADLATAAETE